MANGKSVKALRNAVEGEHLAANALAVAVGKTNNSALQQLLGQIRNGHESNADELGKRLVELGAKYPIPGLRDQLKKGWESVVSSKSTNDALKILHKKEREALVNYKDLLKKVGDEQSMNILLRNMAGTTENVIKLRETLSEMQAKKNKGKGKILGIPWLMWLLAILGGAGYAAYQQLYKQEPANPVTPSSSNS